LAGRAVDAVGRAQEARAEDLLDLADLRPDAVGDVVGRARVEALARLDAQELLGLGLVDVEPDVLLELEALLLDEADRLAERASRQSIARSKSRRRPAKYSSSSRRASSSRAGASTMLGDSRSAIWSSTLSTPPFSSS